MKDNDKGHCIFYTEFIKHRLDCLENFDTEKSDNMKENACSLEEQVGRWEDQRDIKNLMGIYVNYIIMNMDAEIYNALWSARDDVCCGGNEGWYVGPEAVRGYYDAVHARNALVAELLQKKFPQEIGQRTAEENFGIGTFRDFPVACPVIEIARDGHTAKGLWYCWGSQAQVLSCGPTSSWTWGYYAADFVRENGSWRIWHLQITNDVDARCGTDWGRPEEKLPDLPEFMALRDFSMPAYSVAQVNRAKYSAQRPLTGSPRIPEPYDTFADTFSYGV